MFVDAPFDLNFFKNKVFHSFPLIEDTDYIKWLYMVHDKKMHFLRDLGIFDLIQLS